MRQVRIAEIHQSMSRLQQDGVGYGVIFNLYLVFLQKVYISGQYLAGMDDWW